MKIAQVKDEYPFVSVAVVAYNAEKYIEECLSSLVNQSYPKNRYEILLINGNSTDRTIEIASKFKNVKIISNPKIIISAGRNLAIENSKGKYLAFTDSDCKVDTNWLKVLVEKIEKSPPEVVAYGGPNLIFDTDPPLAKVIGYMQETYIGSGGSPQSYKINEEKDVISIPNCNVIYKKNIIETFRYDERLNVGEDCDFNSKLKERKFKFIYTNEAIVWHHRRASIKSFVKNMFLYGEAQAKIARYHGKLERKYSIIPSLAILFILAMVILSLFNLTILLIFITLIGIYLILIIYSSVYVIKKVGIYGFVAIILLPLQHFVYGIGFFRGVIK